MQLLKYSCVQGMPVSNGGAATRALVALLLLLARHYELVLEINRDSSPEQLVKAYKKVLLKVHPDRGGRKEDARHTRPRPERLARGMVSRSIPFPSPPGQPCRSRLTPKIHHGLGPFGRKGWKNQMKVGYDPV